MTGEEGKISQMEFDIETQETINQIILACGVRPLQEKISLLYLTIDYIFHHNPHLKPKMSDNITIH